MLNTINISVTDSNRCQSLNLARSKLQIFHRYPLFNGKVPSSCYLDMVAVSMYSFDLYWKMCCSICSL